MRHSFWCQCDPDRMVSFRCSRWSSFRDGEAACVGEVAGVVLLSKRAEAVKRPKAWRCELHGLARERRGSAELAGSYLSDQS